MHSVLWASILASAGVALVTTLLVEYLAKPGLEARKDRILEDKRSQRSALRDLDRISYLAYNARLMRHSEENPAERKRLVQYAEEIEPLLLNSVKVLQVPGELHSDWIMTTTSLLNLAIAAQDHGFLNGNEWEQFIAIYYRWEQCRRLLLMARWKFLRRYKIIDILLKRRMNQPKETSG